MDDDTRRAKRREYNRSYRERHRERLREYHAKWEREKYASDPEYREAKKQKARNWRAPPADGVCEICGVAKRLVTDHDHTTGLVRGRICYGCNTGIGMLGDTVDGLERALAYLKRSAG